jgi:hypothetical protein
VGDSNPYPVAGFGDLPVPKHPAYKLQFRINALSVLHQNITPIEPITFFVNLGKAGNQYTDGVCLNPIHHHLKFI